MKASFALLGLCVTLSSFAQTSASDSNSQSSASTYAVGNQQTVGGSQNQQSITFITQAPAESRSAQVIDSRSTQTIDSRSSQTLDSRSDQNITTNGTSTQNLVSSGTTKNIVEYSGSYTMKNVPSVSGPPLTTSNDTCMGSSSGSANGPGFGVSFGSTWSDDHCKRLKMSRELWNKGMKAASLAVDCMDPTARLALEITGTMCPQSMTTDERRTNYGPSASAEGAPTGPATASIAVASPVSSNGVQATSVIDAPATASLYSN